MTPLPLPAAAAHSGHRAAPDRRRAADDPADPQPAARLPGRAHRRFGVRGYRRDSRRAIRTSTASLRCRRGRQSQALACAARLVGRYDLAISTQSGDRPTVLRFSRPDANVLRRWRIVCRAASNAHCFAPCVSDTTHARIAWRRCCASPTRSGSRASPELVSPQASGRPDLPHGDIAVVHAAPMFHYKRWTRGGLARPGCGIDKPRAARARDRGPGDRGARLSRPSLERRQCHARRRAAKLGRTRGLLARARVFVGPDTSVTHLSCCVRCPTVALYGPTIRGSGVRGRSADCPSHGPRPVPCSGAGMCGWCSTPFPCTPCQLEGCERHLESYSACLDALSLEQVMDAVDQALSTKILAKA